jgi:preprotein translocase subunit SecE
MIQYLKEVKRELKKVSWPSQQEIIRMTVTVIIVSTGVAGFMTVLDILFKRLLNLLIGIV